MSERKQTNCAIEENNRASEQQESKTREEGLSRRTFLGVGSAGLATAAFTSLAANAQERSSIAKAERDHSASNPGPENKPLLEENPASNFPPPTDYGNIVPVWYSFDLPHMRIQEEWLDEPGNTIGPTIFNRHCGS